jgi:hypothetical protein
MDSMVIPPEMQDIDLTKSTEIAIKQAMWEEYQANKKKRNRSFCCLFACCLLFVVLSKQERFYRIKSVRKRQKKISQRSF